MAVNLIHSMLRRVDKGWDPISSEYAQQYADHASHELNVGVVERLNALSGGLRGKKVIDLGGGPANYSVLFAKLGADVTWHDPSREYLRIAKSHAKENGVPVTFSLGYLEEARRFGAEAFDLVFCRVCWYYGRGDRSFARLLYRLLKLGGIGYVECNIPAGPQPLIRRVQSWSNEFLWLKIGHPLPPHGRIAKLFHQYPIRFMEIDYQSPAKDIVTFMKA
jgi:SAM-dependent methyltransferase